jgi:HPt (histidine-containing phosphotransfer) domain-containing protein
MILSFGPPRSDLALWGQKYGRLGANGGQIARFWRPAGGVKKSFTNGVKQRISSALRAVRFTLSWRFAAHSGAQENYDRLAGERVMIASTASGALDAADSPADAAVIDEDHLGRMTLGDRQLEREVLEIFVRQTVIMLERIAGAEPALAAATAHTLMGSARGIGAWRVARAAERLEQAARGKSGATEPDLAVELDLAVEELKAATIEAGAAIAVRLGRDLRDH